MIRVVHSRSRIRILTLSIPDPVSRGKKAPDPGSRIRNTMQNQSTNSMELMPGVLKSFKIRAQALSPFTQTYVL
jgi:hypothetical protein